MLDFIFHRDETNSKIVEAKYNMRLRVIKDTNRITMADDWELRRLVEKFAVMKNKEDSTPPATAERKK